MPLRTARKWPGSLAVALFAGATLAGCKSAFVEAVVRNNTAEPVALIEVDYPSASFGRASLAPHSEFHYRFKILGAGGTRVQWTDSKRQEHTVAGPELREGEQGKIVITIEGATAQWNPDLR